METNNDGAEELWCVHVNSLVQFNLVDESINISVFNFAEQQQWTFQ
jgi:hypothetical protein